MRLSCGADPRGATSIETTTEPAGAQTQFFPRPGAVSFKRWLDGSLVNRPSSLCVDVRRLVEADPVPEGVDDLDAK